MFKHFWKPAAYSLGILVASVAAAAACWQAVVVDELRQQREIETHWKVHNDQHHREFDAWKAGVKSPR